MADDLFSALFGGMSNPTSGSADVNAFNKTVAANDIWRSAAGAVGNANFDTRTWTPNQAIGANVAKAFLGSILGSVAQDKEAQQTNKLLEVLPQLYSNPNSVGAPEGIDRQAFNAFKMNAMAKKAEDDAAIRKAYATSFGGNYDPVNNSVSLIPGAQEAMMELYTKKSELQNKDDDLRIKKQQQQLENTVYNRVTNLPSYKLLADVESNVNALKDLSSQDSKASDVGLISTVARIRDPNSTVREGEFKLNSDTQSYLDQLVGDWRSVVTGGSRLTPEAKKGIIASVLPKYNQLVESYDSQKTPLLEALERQGGNSLNVPTPNFSKLSVDDFFPPDKNAKEYKSSKDDTSGMGTSALADFIAQAKAQGLSKEQARQKWLSMGK